MTLALQVIPFPAAMGFRALLQVLQSAGDVVGFQLALGQKDMVEVSVANLSAAGCLQLNVVGQGDDNAD